MLLYKPSWGVTILESLFGLFMVGWVKGIRARAYGWETSTPRTIGDNQDGNEGHGTHVVGTLVGRSVSTQSWQNKYNGVAFESKVFFQDIQATGQSVSGLSKFNSTDLLPAWTVHPHHGICFFFLFFFLWMVVSLRFE